MEAIMACLFPCISNHRRRNEATIARFEDEKQAFLPLDSDARTEEDPEEVAEDIVQAILTAKGRGDLDAKLSNMVNATYNWRAKVAEWVLAKLAAALECVSKLSPYVKAAYDKACEEAQELREFVQEHPVWCTVIAMGVLVQMTPWVLAALGFGPLGPVEGTFAARWMAQYAGYVPKGSFYSFLQRLGMTWV